MAFLFYFATIRNKKTFAKTYVYAKTCGPLCSAGPRVFLYDLLA